MTVRARLLSLLSVLAALFLIGAFVLHESENRRIEQLSETDHREKTLFFTKILDLKGASLQALAYDYTYWDEMAEFVRSRDPRWATQNLNSALATYKTDGIWVYTPKMRLVYSTCGGGHGALKNLPLPSGALSRSFHGRQFCHFFLLTQQGILEIRGAQIHASQDEKRAGKSFGIFLAGRLWDSAYLGTMSDLTAAQASLKLLRPGDPVITVDRDGDDVVDFYKRITGADGKNLAYLHLAAPSRSVQLFRTSSSRMMVLIIIFITLMLVLLSICLLHWVSSPLKSLSLSLATQDLERIQALQEKQTEFGALARLIENFFAQKAELEAAHDQLELRVAKRTVELADANQLLENAYTATIMGWSRAMDLRDHETEGHCQRVTELTLLLAQSLGLPESELVLIRRGALLHDIGKMGIPDNILRKPGQLTDDEWLEMRRHPEYAYEMLAPISFLHTSIDIPWCHHEKWDGSGYPRGLQGEEIPLSARLFSIVDVWDALCSDRPYRKGWPPGHVLDYIESLSGSHFDPSLVPHFRLLVERQEMRLAA